MLLEYLCYLLCAGVVINMFYYLCFYRIASVKPSSPTGHVNAVSIIVCAKNEATNLKRLLPALLGQDHQNFEVIVINDCSSDGTLDIIDGFTAIDPRVKMVNVIPNENFWGNKKYALTLGIKKAQHSHLLFIDADCEPGSSSWASIMSGEFTWDRSIVLGYSGYQKTPGLLNALIRFETGMTAMQYLNYALLGNPYMGVGRNLAYTTSEFYAVRGFQDHLHIMGGDDDLFINKVAKKSNTRININPKAFTYSQAKQSWNSWWIQKRRHINTAHHYKSKDKFLLGLFHASQITILSALLLLPWLSNPLLWLMTAIIILRYVISWTSVGLSLSRFRESGLIPLYPLLEIILILTQLGLLVSNILSKPKRWK
ncbi:MAG: glycosyltransferase [Nonlabens sp.]